jgi:hypothetical protein
LEIVYCGGCGKALREDDFSRGQARVLDNRPWCAECRPPDKKPITSAIPAAGARKSGSSAKHPRVSSGTVRREAPAAGSNRGLFIGLGIAGAGLLLLLAYMASGGGTPPSVTLPPPRRTPDPLPPNPASADAERLLKELEALASLSPADRILARCEEIRSKMRGTPQEKRFQEIELAAIDQKKTRDQEGRLTRELEELRKLIDEDPRFAKYDDVIRRFKAVKTAAGSRSAEVDRRLAEYEKSRKESPHQKHLGPFPTDDEGFIRNWLVLGVFPNDKDKGIDTDFLGGESLHDPVDGMSVGKLKWGAFASVEAKIDFFKVPSLDIKRPKDNVVAYAACLVQVPIDVAAEFRLGSDDGAALWVYGTQVGKVHAARKLAPDTDRYAVPLPAGVHRVLLKVEQHSKDFEFVLRVVGPDGQRVGSLRVWN